MPIVIPPVIMWTLGAIGAVALARFVAREWRRVNAELERQDRQPAAPEPVDREQMPKLRRDASGVYRPE